MAGGATYASSTNSAPSQPGAYERVAVVEIRLQEFRNFEHCSIPLDNHTLLVGENNTGKSSFLHALSLTLGNLQPREEDFRTVNGQQQSEFIIDVRVEPATGLNFDAATMQLLSTAIQTAKAGAKQFVTIRCRGKRDRQEGATSRRCFVRGWASDRATASKLPELTTPPFSGPQRELVTFTVLDAKRDIATELRNRRTNWGRLLTDLQLPAATRADIETKLTALGEVLAKDSVRLSSIQQTLQAISAVTARSDLGVHIAAVPSSVDDLVRYVDLLVGEQPLGALPVQQQGMGTRSLLAIMLFEAFVDDVLKTTAAYTLPVTAIEEPEVHVHPHAQRALLPQLHKLRGQVIVSTHSPYVSSVADIFTVRVFRHEKTGNTVRWLRKLDASGRPRIDNEGVSLLQRFIQRRNGELLFCRVAALFEGDTEESALPAFAEHLLGGSPNSAGVTFVNVNGAGNYKHFVPLLEDLEIPWFILSDADKAGLDGVAAAGAAIGRRLDASSPEVVCLTPGHDFEAQLIADGLELEAENAIATFYGPTALADAKAQLHGTKMKGGGLRDYAAVGWKTRLVHDFLDRSKGSFGTSFAQEVIKSGKQMPHVSDFFDRIKAHL